MPIGMPAADVAQLFQPVYRARNVTQAEMAGTGIGLYIVKEIVARHGAR